MLPSYIKPKPIFWNYIPWIKRQDGTTIGRTIYLRRDIYDNLQSNKPDPLNVGFLLHEQTHRERIGKMGIVMFGLQYLLDPKFRFYEELAAVKASFAHYKKHKVPVDLDRKAKILSSWLYLWPVSYEFARKEVQNAWEQV